MYEQDYVMRLNRDVIRTIVKLIFNKDIEPGMDLISQVLKSEDSRMLDLVYGQVDLGNIEEAENDIFQQLVNKDDRALEKALLFYFYLNEKNDEFLLEHHYDREKIQSGLKNIASQFGILDIVSLLVM
ncbi:DUF6483 family protein [Ruminococcus sp. OA3]|uniref:DUF6483 family protein n=1 Tax=Ruminococcus sp. OA3 TaxID=2914164 RepID=UPI001F05DB33|nr:DUF6483 family protein [Ruminococcus sp. OA3]MCH1982099.1 DUF6483 family protein [Ruminococcus sp. OA3]